MPHQDSALAPAERLRVEYTTKPVSGWGGLVAFMRYLERLRVRDLLQAVLPDGRTSPNQIPVVDIVLTLLVTVLTGGRRFAHVERVRNDEVVRGLLGSARLPSAMTVTRYLSGLARSQVERLSEGLRRFVLSRLRPPALGWVLDVDSTVFERYGQQEGSLKGHNPRKHGRPSHHPILAMLAEAKVVLHAWLRSGNTGSARGVEAFLAETLALLPDGFRLYAVRGDSGFYTRQLLDTLEARQLDYAIVARMTPHLKQAIIGLRAWHTIGTGLAVSELRYHAPTWSAPRRLVVVREELCERPEARGRKLIAVPGYLFHAVVTTLAHPPAEVWRFYNHRADCENRLKELKDDFGVNGFCLRSFDATDATFRLVCFLFNLVALFKRDALPSAAPTLASLRTAVFVVGGILGQDGRQPVLRLGLVGARQADFMALLTRVADVVAATVAQLAQLVGELDVAPPTPWRARRRPPRAPVTAPAGAR
jgi:hypothetical protein